MFVFRWVCGAYNCRFCVLLQWNNNYGQRIELLLLPVFRLCEARGDADGRSSQFETYLILAWLVTKRYYSVQILGQTPIDDVIPR